jgi:ribosomal protein L19
LYTSSLLQKKTYPKFKAGDNITVNYKIIEGGKERIQGFRGDVLKIQGTGATATFTVRKISDGVGVERVFPFFSPNVESVQLNKVVKYVVLNYFISENAVVKVQELKKNVCNHYKIFRKAGITNSCFFILSFCSRHLNKH